MQLVISCETRGSDAVCYNGRVAPAARHITITQSEASEVLDIQEDGMKCVDTFCTERSNQYARPCVPVAETPSCSFLPSFVYVFLSSFIWFISPSYFNSFVLFIFIFPFLIYFSVFIFIFPSYFISSNDFVPYFLLLYFYLILSFVFFISNFISFFICFFLYSIFIAPLS